MAKCRRHFLECFPGGFYDEDYLAWERDYKMDAHRRWVEALSKGRFAHLLAARAYDAIAHAAVRIEARTNLLFSFEKMALRDAVRMKDGARMFAEGLYAFLHGSGTMESRFRAFAEVFAELPRRQTRVATWPTVTVFGFIAQPEEHCFLKPNVTRAAALEYGFDFAYGSKLRYETYASLLEFAERVRRDLRDMRPRDMIDLQSFIWVLGSDEYPW